MDGTLPDPKGYDVHVGYAPRRLIDLEIEHDIELDVGQDDPKPGMSRWKKLLFGAIGLTILAALLIAGILYWLNARQYANTDDAFVQAYITQISPQIDGRVVKLSVDDFEHVKEGQALLQLDPRDFQVKLEQAQAQRAQAAAQLAQTTAGLAQQQAAADQAQANVRVAQAESGQAQSDFTRYRSVDPQAVSRQQVDTASASNKSAQAKVDASRQAVIAAQANVEAQKAMITAAQAALKAADVGVDNAQLQLSYTTITAPRDGQTAQRTVNLGDYVKAGQSLLAVVGDDRWIIANFKETQLAGMRVGQNVTIAVDACPDHELTGRIVGFQPGSGSIFSALPPENASGNYVKVVQRIPVKITLRTEDATRCHLSPGMSVVPSVRVN